MHPFLDHVATLLAAIRRDGRFAAGGRVAFRTPMFTVAGIGEIGFPVASSQIDALAASAAEAPFGRGVETVHDRAVRSTLQIDAGRIAIAGAGWRRMLDEVLDRIRDDLGVRGELRAELYKLLIYRPGDFFKPHRDSEKAPGMVATLVLALPTRSAGGRLIVRHRDEEARFDLGGDDPSETGFAAFYADCLHEVLPVTDGHRLVLTWNLIRDDAGAEASAPDHAAETEALARHLASWPDDAPAKIAIPLEHAYTPAEIGLSRLKGVDRARAEALAAAARRAGVVVGAALMTATETGWAEYAGAPRWRRGRYEEEDEDLFELVGTERIALELSNWDGGDGPTLRDGFPLAADEIAASDFLAHVAEGAIAFHEATGNEGVSYERSYAQAALVFWPEARTADVLLASGRNALAAEIEARCLEGATESTPLASLLGRLAAVWPAPDPRGHDDRAPRLLPAALRGLDALGDMALTGRLLRAVAWHGDIVAEDAAALVAALKPLVASDRPVVLDALARGAIRLRPEAAAALLAQAAAEPDLVGAGALDGGVVDLTALLARAASDELARRMVKPTALADLLTAASALSTSAVAALCDALLADPELYHPDRILLPLARELARRARSPALPLRLRTALLDHLGARIAAPLAPPSDWTRTARLGCDCPDCRAVSAFLAAPDKAELAVRAAQERRTHVERICRGAQADLDYATIKAGSPHQLILRKTDASYRRRVGQRQQDLDDRAMLSGEPPASAP
ncbi:2OG-Fe(II) oxygenase [Rubrimonas cliftonensis]|uniref:2OG-Fe(II) oxygenase superfamily protein n=1 Tax=Rubrimonas cliftonensis TaxID=89524 RepID=A0A1H4GDX9_9RHOB|nr:2OG-Fe(II) oxygenase [Rubrimonas cliftonensis]SEB07108.1 2OG-Fe(II) oxygenase superfamily protein [Rubrimonas cliftonensis]